MSTRVMTLMFNVPKDAPNPFTTETPFGECVAASIYNEFRTSYAVDYALDHPFDGLDWLRAWRDGDDEADAELTNWLKATTGEKP